MKTFMLLIFTLSTSFLSLTVKAQNSFDPISALDQELGAMHELESFLEADELNQLKLYEDYTQLVVNDLSDPNLGIGNVKTFEAFQDQIIGMDAGSLFFQTFAAQYWGKGPVEEINQVQDSMVKAYGFDRHAYDHTLMRFLVQIDRQCEILKHQAAPESILSKLDVQSIDRAMAIVQASTGSRPKAFDAALPIAKLIKSLYGDLAEIPMSSRGLYNAGLALRFFNERLIDYAQYDSL